MKKSASSIILKSNTSRNYPIVNNLEIFKKISAFTKLTPRQKDFFTPKPIKSYERFPSNYNSINNKFFNFIKKDMIKPLSRPSIYEKFDIKSPNYKHIDIYQTKMNKKTKWALGTVARAPNWDTLPKKQQFKNYYFPPEYNNKNPEEYKKYSLKTDFINIKIPELRKNNSVDSFIKMKADYSCSNETKIEHQWVPNISSTSVNNSSSKNYNIINFKILDTPKNYGNQMMNKKLYFRKKGISEICDLMQNFYVNIDKEYTKKYMENPKRFYKFNGIFTNMYDSSNRNGKITLPFDLKSENNK